MKVNIKKTLLIAPLLGTACLMGAAPVAFAHFDHQPGECPCPGEGYQRMISKKAELLGMSEEELEHELETKTFFEIIQEKGLSLDDLFAKAKEMMQARWQEQGLSEEEIQARLQKMEKRHARRQAAGFPKPGKGFRGMRGNQGNK